jgi:hypothetical protein
MKRKLAALAALAVVAICGSMIYLSQSPEVTSQEVASITSTNDINNVSEHVVTGTIGVKLQ